MKVVDLFCGCGGFSLGFEYADFDIIYVLENWKPACETYHANFPKVDLDSRDALDVKPNEVPSCDVLIGSPPCQNFSPANLKKNRGEESGALINWFWSVVKMLKPKFVIMEEVPYVEEFLPRDINMMKRVYRMCDYGVPQIRRRLFAGVFQEPVKTPCKVVFPAVMASEWKGLAQSSVQVDRENMRLASLFRRKSLLPECKLVQTFPLDYVLHGKLQEQYMQVGNAVPPLMAYRLADAILNPNMTLEVSNHSEETTGSGGSK